MGGEHGLEHSLTSRGELIRWPGDLSQQRRLPLMALIGGALGLVLACGWGQLIPALPHTRGGALSAVLLLVGMLMFCVGVGSFIAIIWAGWRLLRGSSGAVLHLLATPQGLQLSHGPLVDWASVGSLFIVRGRDPFDPPVDDPQQHGHAECALILVHAGGQEVLGQELTGPQAQALLQFVLQLREQGGLAARHRAGGGVDTVRETADLDAVTLSWSGRGGLRVVLAMATVLVAYGVLRVPMGVVVSVLGVEGSRAVLAYLLLPVLPALPLLATAIGTFRHQVRVDRSGVTRDQQRWGWEQLGRVQAAREGDGSGLARSQGLLGGVERVLLGWISQPDTVRTWQVVSISAGVPKAIAMSLTRAEAERLAQAIDRLRPAELGERDDLAEQELERLRGRVSAREP